MNTNKEVEWRRFILPKNLNKLMTILRVFLESIWSNLQLRGDNYSVKKNVRSTFIFISSTDSNQQ